MGRERQFVPPAEVRYDLSIVQGATYPGTASPLRGLIPFAESERDVFFGRDREVEELARLVVGEGYRAGLLYGEAGVGKSSLLRAGLIPHLRDQGVFALVCEDISDPLTSFGNALLGATNIGANEGENPIQYMARVVGQALPGQLFLFIVDEVDRVLASDDERLLSQLAEVFARVVSRSGGRARFLFSCSSQWVYALGALEKKTGSLFPPSNRFELKRFDEGEAAMVIDRTFALAGLACEPQVAKDLVRDLGSSGRILPAELQLSALAIRDLGITQSAQLDEIGGFADLRRSWLIDSAAQTGGERAALRLLAELAQGDGLVPQPVDQVAARANVAPEQAQGALAVLQGRVVVRSVPVAGAVEKHFALAHQILANPVREVAAPAREAARRAFELLGSKAESKSRLSGFEWYSLHREGIAPSTPDEAGVVARTKRFFYIVAGIAVGLPIALLIILYISMSGQYYLDVARPGGGGPETIVVRAGRPGLSSFFWLPKSPSFGEIIADTGFTKATVGDETWEELKELEHSGADEGAAYVSDAFSAVLPAQAGVIQYASSGSAKVLRELLSGAKSDEQKAALLRALTPVTRGGVDEESIISTYLSNPSATIQSAALGASISAAQRNPGAYKTALRQALSTSNAELRRLSLSAVRILPDKQRAELLTAAIADAADGNARRELLAATGSANTDSGGGSAAAAAAAQLADAEAPEGEKAQARSVLARGLTATPKAAANAALNLAINDQANPKERVFALETLFDKAPESAYSELKGNLGPALKSASEPVKAAALPLLARIDPDAATTALTGYAGRSDLTPAMRKAVALAWGEVARATKEPAAIPILEEAAKDTSPKVRAAAAQAYGNVGRPAQGNLIKMVKNERFDVAVGAAYGLVNTAWVGASESVAIGGINQLWKRKGKPRRRAAEVYTKLARKKPRRVFSYLVSASRHREDSSLHSIGARGLCNALRAKDKRALRALTQIAGDESVEVRRIVSQCIVDTPDANANALAMRLARDSDPQIRADAARVLVRTIKSGGKLPKGAGSTIAKLAGDRSREAKMLAIGALGELGSAAPKGAKAALPIAFKNADESDKLTILAAARKLGAGGLAPIALADASPTVRMAALQTAVATNSDVVSSVNTALADPDTSVRRAAVERIADGTIKLPTKATAAVLQLAARDENEQISDLALTTLARVGDKAQVIERLSGQLRSRSERERAQAAAASRGLAERDAKSAKELLEPLYSDDSHDVRAAMLPSMAVALARVHSAEDLAKAMRKTERHTTKRLALAAAFFDQASNETKRSAAISSLKSVIENGRPLVSFTARLTLGLIEAKADGRTFLAALVP